MKELTQNTPKPLLEIQGVRFLDYAFFLVKEWGAKDILLNTHFLSEQFDDWARMQNLEEDRKIRISKEESILGTGGGIFTGIQKFWYPELIPKRINPGKSNLPAQNIEKFLVMNPDTLLFPENSDFTPAANQPSDSLCHLYLLPKKPTDNYTGLGLENGHVRFLDSSHPSKSEYYYCGLSVFKPEAFQFLPWNPGEKYELSTLWKSLSINNLLTGEVFPGKAMDVGEKELFDQLNSQKDFWGNLKTKIYTKN
jgi:MurNAc alpha-1-phosphate uridylyltransferase